MFTVKINPYPPLLASFLLAIFYLAGMAFGGVLFFIFFALLLLVLASWAGLLVSYLKLRFYQETSNDHPVKGDSFKYKLCLENEGPIPNPCVSVRFKPVGGVSQTLKPFSAYLRRKEKLVMEYEIHCPFRGVYTVGLESVKVTDILSWISIEPEVWHRTFYVYPRVIALRSFFLDRHSRKYSAGHARGTQEDELLFRGLESYRQGMQTKRIYWKKYAAMGEPYCKISEATSSFGVDVYLDLGRDGEATDEVLEREDTSVEIAISVSRYFLDRLVPTAFHAVGEMRYDFAGIDSSRFAELHKATLSFFFKKCPSLARALRFDARSGRGLSGTLLVVTHSADPELFELMYELPVRGVACHLVINQTGMDEAQKRKCEQYGINIAERGGSIRIVRDSSTIREDLEESR